MAEWKKNGKWKRSSNSEKTTMVGIRRKNLRGNLEVKSTSAGEYMEGGVENPENC